MLRERVHDCSSVLFMFCVLECSITAPAGAARNAGTYLKPLKQLYTSPYTQRGSSCTHVDVLLMERENTPLVSVPDCTVDSVVLLFWFTVRLRPAAILDRDSDKLAVLVR